MAWYEVPGYAYLISDKLEVLNLETGKMQKSFKGRIRMSWQVESNTFSLTDVLALARDDVPIPVRRNSKNRSVTVADDPREGFRTITLEQHWSELRARQEA